MFVHILMGLCVYVHYRSSVKYIYCTCMYIRMYLRTYVLYVLICRAVWYSTVCVHGVLIILGYCIIKMYLRTYVIRRYLCVQTYVHMYVYA